MSERVTAEEAQRIAARFMGVEKVFCDQCPFDAEPREAWDEIANDPTEAHYKCPVLGRDVWGEAPLCGDRIIPLMADTIAALEREAKPVKFRWEEGDGVDNLHLGSSGIVCTVIGILDRFSIQFRAPFFDPAAGIWLSGFTERGSRDEAHEYAESCILKQLRGGE